MSAFKAFSTGAPSVSENRRSRKRLQDGHSPDDIDVAIGQGRVRPVGFFIFNTVTKRLDDSLGINSPTRSPLGIITPPEVANTGPGVNRGSGGGARGCGFEERVGVYARTEGGHFL